jgi:crotonobetainyl-CoA:carnitine CoA-transferase CaiB-like acyl-CoA transferase
MVRTLDEVYAWDQTASQGLRVDDDHPTLGRVTLPGPPLRFFGPDGREQTRTSHAAPPLLDEDHAAVAAWLDAPVDLEEVSR